MGRVGVETHAAVARHGLRDVDKQRLRHREPGVTLEDVDNLLGVVAGRAGVPESQGSDAVGVHVLRRALELREGSERDASGRGVLVIDLEKHGLI